MNPYRAYVDADNIDDENKPRLLLKVYQALLDKIDIVKAAIRNKDFQKKYEELTKVTMIMELLDSSLDMSQGEIAKNLSELYRYLVRRLMSVHANQDPAILDECRAILAQINEGFVGAYNKETAARTKTQKVEGALTSSRSAYLV
jgi:flagellar secretion chaperone FliS